MKKGYMFILIGLLISIILAVFISPFASESPDGLERVAKDLNFINRAEGKEVIQAPLPDYSVPSIKNKTISGSFAGFIGTVITFVIAVVIGYVFKLYKSKSKNDQVKSIT